MSENARSDVAELSAAVTGLTSMVRARVRRAHRDSDELRRLTAQLANATELLAAAIAAETDTREGYGT